MSKNQPDEPRGKPRRKALAEMRKRLIARSYPRLVVFLILTASGIVAFSVSVLTLAFGLDEMGLRYFVATAAGYLAFLLLIRVWIALHRTGRNVDLGWDVDPGTPDLGERASTGGSEAAFGGGHSGGGDASGDWDSRWSRESIESFARKMRDIGSVRRCGTPGCPRQSRRSACG